MKDRTMTLHPKLAIAMAFVKRYIAEADCGLFDRMDSFGDRKKVLYNYDGLVVQLCPDYQYLEVLGLPHEQFYELKEFYDSLLDKVVNG